MVKKIKKVKRRAKGAGGRGGSTWLVPFTTDGQAAIYIHRHGDGDDHSNCGPVVLCCERAVAPYRAAAPDLHGQVDSLRKQRGDHLCTWLDSGVQAMYFVLCDHHDPHSIYQFGLPAGQARALLTGLVPQNAYRRPDNRITSTATGGAR